MLLDFNHSFILSRHPHSIQKRLYTISVSIKLSVTNSGKKLGKIAKNDMSKVGNTDVSCICNM